MNSFIYAFEKLEVWQLSRKLAVKVYHLTSIFPPEEKFGLTAQMRKSAISVSSNIAEGTSRKTKKEKARFVEIAYGSSLELLSQTILASDLQFCSMDDVVFLRKDIERLTNKLNGLRNSYL